MNEWWSQSASTQQDWEALIKKELKTEDLGRILTRPMAEGIQRPVLANEGPRWFDASFRRAALSLTWTREEDVKWDEIPALVSQGIGDFILDPFLLNWDESRLKRELTRATEILRSSEARLWVISENALLPKNAFHVLSAQEIVVQGGHAAHELGFLLTRLIDWAQSHKGESIAVAVTLDREFFKSIGKLRALKAITEAAFREMGQAELLSRVTWMARVDWRDFTALDCTNNILRNATSVAAAYVGGAGVVESLPFDLVVELSALERERARRLTLTTQLVLQNESMLGEVTDPAAGSFALEDLTRTLGEEAWKVMQRLNKLDSVERLTALNLEIEKNWNEAQKKFRTRRLVQTGVNDFPEPQEKPKIHPRWIKDDHMRLARGFEELRLTLGDDKPEVAIAVVGDYASLQARLNFTKNYFELLGLKVHESGRGFTINEAQEWFKTQDSSINVWVSADDLHPQLINTGKRCYIAGKTSVIGCLNMYTGQDVLATLEELVLWWRARL